MIIRFELFIWLKENKMIFYVKLYLVDRKKFLQWLAGSMAATGLKSLFFLRADWSESMPVQLFTDDILIYLFIVFIYLLIY
jgi:hypothetical protein